MLHALLIADSGARVMAAMTYWVRPFDATHGKCFSFRIVDGELVTTKFTFKIDREWHKPPSVVMVPTVLRSDKAVEFFVANYLINNLNL